MPQKLHRSEKFDAHLPLLTALIGLRNSERLLTQFSSLHMIAQSTDEELQENAPKLSQTQITKLRSAFRLGAAFASEIQPEYTTVLSSKSIADTVRWRYRLAKNEEMHVLNMDTVGQLISVKRIATGTIDSVSISVRDAFASAITTNASMIALTHNHPSGSHHPSDQDINLTQKFADIGRLMGIYIRDHVVMGMPSPHSAQDYSSMRDLRLVDFDDYQDPAKAVQPQEFTRSL